MYRVNVSSVQDFMQCRFRWWAKWVMNRVPVATSPALDAGKILHRAFERSEGGVELSRALAEECAAFRKLIPDAHPAAQIGAEKAVVVMEDLIEAMPLWRDKFPVDAVLEVEQPFEWRDPEDADILWVGRPDRVVLSGSRVWHQQRRGLAASMNFGMYIRLAKRHYHEHLYGRYLREKYPKRGKKKLTYGGTVFDLVRKLKFRTNVGKKNEATKTAEEMFFQQSVSYDLNGQFHRAVMMALRYHVHEMRRVVLDWEHDRIIPAPNEKMNGGYSGNSEDPYFKLLIGEVSLDDNSVFKAREDTYETADTSE